jgi:hypothetical protein
MKAFAFLSRVHPSILLRHRTPSLRKMRELLYDVVTLVLLFFYSLSISKPPVLQFHVHEAS